MSTLFWVFFAAFFVEYLQKITTPQYLEIVPKRRGIFCVFTPKAMPPGKKTRAKSHLFRPRFYIVLHLFARGFFPLNQTNL